MLERSEVVADKDVQTSLCDLGGGGLVLNGQNGHPARPLDEPTGATESGRVIDFIEPPLSVESVAWRQSVVPPFIEINHVSRCVPDFESAFLAAENLEVFVFLIGHVTGTLNTHFLISGNQAGSHEDRPVVREHPLRRVGPAHRVELQVRRELRAHREHWVLRRELGPHQPEEWPKDRRDKSSLDW